MSQQTTRRQFLWGAAAGGLGAWASQGARASRAQNRPVRFGCIGVGGKGDSDTADANRLGVVAAICDVDDNTLDAAAKKYPNAKRFNDYRQMLAEMRNEIDAVTVSVPDHNHAPAAALAMMMGKHCFCQKPLAHSVYEVRQLRQIAAHARVVTQMGNQGTAESGLRKAAAQVRAGALGAVTEVHVWTNRPIWDQGIPAPPPAPMPPNLHWDLWLGPAAARPYASGYHPFSWRGFWDFGTGALGDMACHTMNLPFMALELRDPVAFQAETTPDNHYSYPRSSVIHYQFEATRARPAVTLTWYDGGNKPPADLLEGQKMEDSGSLMVGDKGKYYSPGDYGDEGTFIRGVDVGDVSFPVSPGHFDEFVRAIQGGPAPMSNFPNYAGPLAEMVVSGNLAMWAAPKRVLWDARRLRSPNAPELEPIIRPHYRKGYRV